MVAPNLNITINGEVLVDSEWYTIDGGLTNYTFSGTTGIINQLVWDGKGNKQISILFYVNDSLGNIRFNSIEVSKIFRVV
jgi:hypothetical protein